MSLTDSTLLAIYAPMVYTAPCVMFFMRADPLRGQVGGGWALEIETFLGPVKWHQAVRRVPFGAQKVERKKSFPCIGRIASTYARTDLESFDEEKACPTHTADLACNSCTTLGIECYKDRGARTSTLCQSMYRERTHTEDGVGEELGQYLRFSIYIRSAPDNAA